MTSPAVLRAAVEALAYSQCACADGLAKLARHGRTAAIALAALLLSPVSLTCGGDVATAQQTGLPEGRPPPPPASGAKGDGPGTVLAVTRLFFGDKDIDGTPRADAWKHFGYNIDGEVSSSASSLHCKARDGGNQASTQTDGEHGIDNSFGQNIVPILAGLDPSFAGKMNLAIAQGAYALILQIDGVGIGADYTGLRAAAYEGALLDHAPAWDGTDSWPVLCEYLSTCEPSGTPSPPGNPSRLLFPRSYLNDHVWVSGEPGEVTIALDRLGEMAPLRLHVATISLRLGTEAPAPRSGIEGVISGVIDTNEFLADLARMAHEASTLLCDDPWGPSPLGLASDIMRDGSQDPGSTCDGISVGLGFEARAIRLGQALDEQTVEPDPCAR